MKSLEVSVIIFADCSVCVPGCVSGEKLATIGLVQALGSSHVFAEVLKRPPTFRGASIWTKYSFLFATGLSDPMRCVVTNVFEADSSAHQRRPSNPPTEQICEHPTRG